MPTPQRNDYPAVVERLFLQPQRFEFFQALRIADQWLRMSQPPQPLEGVLRFRHSVSLSFPASDIAALSLQQGQWHITPTLMGYLGVCGVLPYCYTDAIAAQLQVDASGRAFFDTFCHRQLTLFYRAWQQGRVEYRLDALGRPALLAMQLALAGANGDAAGEGLPYETIAYYAALIRQRPASAAVIEQVLNDYFEVPFRIEPLTGGWQNIPEEERARLGAANCILGRIFLGRRYWRRDLVQVRIGPLCRADFERFLPDGTAAAALQSMLTLFALPGTRFVVRPILRAQDIQRIALDHRTVLGRGAVLITRPTTVDHDGTRYEIVI